MDSATSDTTLALTAFTAALAAGALYFAWRTVRETRAMRRDEETARRMQRLERVGELVGELGRLSAGNPSYDELRLLQRRMTVTLALLPEPVTVTRALAAAELVDAGGTATVRTPELVERAGAALEEIAATIAGGGP